MNVLRPTRQLLPGCMPLRSRVSSAVSTTAATAPAIARCRHRNFHTSKPREARRRPKYVSLTARELGLVTSQPDARVSFDVKGVGSSARKPMIPRSELQAREEADSVEREAAARSNPYYTAEEEAKLASKYTPAQLEALRMAERAIDPLDLERQRSTSRPFPGLEGYPEVDDFARTRPTIDHVPGRGAPPTEPWPVLPTDDAKFAEELEQFVRKFSPDESKLNLAGMPWKERVEVLRKNSKMTTLDVMKFMLGEGKAEGGETRSFLFSPDEVMAPSLPAKVPGMVGTDSGKPGESDDADIGWKEASLKTGLSEDYIQGKLAVKVVHKRHVTVQKGEGKKYHTSVLSIAGNKDGWLGVGHASGSRGNDLETNRRANTAAIKNMKPILRYENRTIFGNVEAKVASTVVQLFARPPGFGARVSPIIFEMCKAAGIHDISARVPKSRNQMNVVKAVYKALTSQKHPEDIAIGRGKKFVDVRKVYYGGNVF